MDSVATQGRAGWRHWSGPLVIAIAVHIGLVYLVVTAAIRIRPPPAPRMLFSVRVQPSLAPSAVAITAEAPPVPTSANDVRPREATRASRPVPGQKPSAPARQEELGEPVAANESTEKASPDVDRSATEAETMTIANALDSVERPEAREAGRDERTSLVRQRKMAVAMKIIAPNSYRRLTKEELFSYRLNHGDPEARVYFLPARMLANGAMPVLTERELNEISERLLRALIAAESPIVHFHGPGKLAADELSLKEMLRNVAVGFSFDLSPEAISLSQGRNKVAAREVVDEGVVAVTLRPNYSP